MSIDILITKVRDKDSRAQKELFDRYAPKMLGVCVRYIKDIHFAEDVLIEGFLKIYNNMDQYSVQGSFEGWMRRIMVNTCLDHIRKNQKLQFVEFENQHQVESIEMDELSDDKNASKDLNNLLAMIDELPDGYKLIFSLYVLDDYSHKEIAERLGISVSTSKSQLLKAKAQLKNKYESLNRIL